MILVEPLVGLPIVGLRVFRLPGRDLLLVDPDRAVLDPGIEAVLNLLGVVGADPGLVAVVPTMDAADQILAFDVAVAQKGATVHATAVENRSLLFVGPPDHDQIDVCDQRIGGLQGLELIPVGNLDLFHSISPSEDSPAILAQPDP